MDVAGIKTTEDLIQFLDEWMRDVEGRKEREEKWRKEHPCCDNCKYSLHECGDIFCEYWEGYQVEKSNKCPEWR